VYKGCAPLRFFILLQLLIKKKKKNSNHVLSGLAPI
jgi:hypothetical protein